MSIIDFTIIPATKKSAAIKKILITAKMAPIVHHATKMTSNAMATVIHPEVPDELAITAMIRGRSAETLLSAPGLGR